MRELNKCQVCSWCQPFTCLCKPELDSPFVGIQPTFISVDSEFLRSSLSCIESGAEYATEVLQRHDANCGRALGRHKREAMAIEQDIERMIAACVALRTFMGLEKGNTGT